MIHIVYIPATGKIIQKSYSSQAVQAPVPPGMESMVIDGEGYGTLNIAMTYVDTSTQKLVSMPEQPSQYHVFNYTTRKWDVSNTLAWEDIRAKRDRLLAECDWTTMPDVPLSDARKEAWVAYRQALRDITKQSNPLALVWPTPPN